MKLKKLLVGALVALGASHAMAVDVHLGTVTGSAPIGNLSVIGTFTDTFTFDLTGSSTVGAGISNVSISFFGGPTFGAISGFSALLNSTALSFSSQTVGGGVTFVSQLLSGSGVFSGTGNVLTVTGDAGAGAAYSGILAVTPVPEPETLAMMLAGIGALGFMVRRRNAG